MSNLIFSRENRLHDKKKKGLCPGSGRTYIIPQFSLSEYQSVSSHFMARMGALSNNR